VIAEQLLRIDVARLTVVVAAARAVDAARVGAGLSIRPRHGGERIRLAGERTRRALKSILRESSLPTWERDALPLVVAGDVLVAVPGIGVDEAWQAGPGLPGRLPVWRARP